MTIGTGAQVGRFAVETTGIAGLLVARMTQVKDGRGTIREFFRGSSWADAGVVVPLPAQVNITETVQGAVRGMHAEHVTKLVAVAAGEAAGRYLDLRDGSSTWGRVEKVSLVPGVEVLVPAGVANGFQAVAPGATQFLYGFSAEWRADLPGLAVTPLDQGVGLDWPLPLDRDDLTRISAKDATAPTLASLRSAIGRPTG